MATRKQLTMSKATLVRILTFANITLIKWLAILQTSTLCVELDEDETEGVHCQDQTI
jgi:hypothetical protein